jgi:hypothetical protein
MPLCLLLSLRTAPMDHLPQVDRHPLLAHFAVKRLTPTTCRQLHHEQRKLSPRESVALLVERCRGKGVYRGPEPLIPASNSAGR